MDNVQRATREYLISLITTLKKTRSALAEQRQEVDKWNQRMQLAQEKGRADLVAQAQQRMQAAEQTLEKLRSEEQEVMREFREARTKYKIESMIPQKSIDPDQLLAALESVAGKPDNLQAELDRTAVDEQLAALKRELQSGSSKNSGLSDEPDESREPGTSPGEQGRQT